MNQILPYRAYHGVEHQKSTVISLGPSYEVFGKLYKELLGVSSHELYHTWNVKAIRPIEMYPYDFTKENYSKLGYICEGVTTYQGDLFLLKSGVFNEEQYFDNIPLVAWEFYIGGYQPAQKWLKDRKGRTLEFDDILHYQKIIVALSETDRLMKEIDKIEIE